MKIFMKTRPLTTSLVVAGMSMATSFAQAEGFDLSEKLSVTGFIDMSTYYSDVDGGESTAASGLDQFEIDFLYDFGDGLKAQVDLEYQDDGRTLTVVDSTGTEIGTTPVGDEVDIEQAFFTYGLNDNVTLKAGRFLSYSGWETEEPTGLFQYSGAGYAKYFYGGYQQGTSVLYSTDTFDVALSVVNDLGDLEGTATNSKKPGFETMLAFKPTESVTAKAFYLSDEDNDKINLWAMYGMDSMTFAVEYNMADFADKSEASGYLLMANYAMDKMGITVRYHGWEVESGAGATTEEMTGLTISPSYAVSDNLLLVAEYRMDSDELTDGETDTVALEALISF